MTKKKAPAKQTKTAAKTAKSQKPAKANGTSRKAPATPVEDPDQIAVMIREGELPPSELKKKKSGLNKTKLKYYRQLLLEKRADILGDVASMELARGGGDGGNLSHMPMHMADVGSDNFEQEFTLGLVESERKLLTEIDEALTRMDEGYFGVCVITGNPIEEPRLEIKPWAKYCIAVVRTRERLGLG